MTFLKSESGAVTVDWVVLTAGLVGLGLATMTVVSSGVQDLSTDVDETLSTSFICTTFVTCNNQSYWEAALAYGRLEGQEMTQLDAAQEIMRIYDYDDGKLAIAAYQISSDAQRHLDGYAVMQTYDGSPAARDALAQHYGFADAAAMEAILPAEGLETFVDVVEYTEVNANLYHELHTMVLEEATARGLTADDIPTPDPKP